MESVPNKENTSDSSVPAPTSTLFFTGDLMDQIKDGDASELLTDVQGIQLALKLRDQLKLKVYMWLLFICDIQLEQRPHYQFTQVICLRQPKISFLLQVASEITNIVNKNKKRQQKKNMAVPYV